MKRFMQTILIAAAACLTLSMGGPAVGDEAPGATPSAPATGADVFSPSELARTCTPLGGSCRSLTECCIGRCINGRCLKL